MFWFKALIQNKSKAGVKQEYQFAYISVKQDNSSTNIYVYICKTGVKQESVYAYRMSKNRSKDFIT